MKYFFTINADEGEEYGKLHEISKSAYTALNNEIVHDDDDNHDILLYTWDDVIEKYKLGVK